MLFRTLGRTGLKVSLFSLGSWITFGQLEKGEISESIAYAYDSGINLFDTAEVYGEGEAEKKLGESLYSLNIPRQKFLLCTKVFWGGNSLTECGLTRKHIIEGCHQSLKRLKTDYLDFYLCHRPDPNTPIEETVIAMNLLMQQGKILYWGTSEWPKDLILEAYYVAKQSNLAPPSIEQLEYNLFNWENGNVFLPDIQAKTGIGAITTMPLACGVLAGRYNTGIPKDSRAGLTSHPCFKEAVESESGKKKIQKTIKLEELSKQYNISLPNLVLYWCLSNKNISSIILGTSKLKQLKQNIETIGLFERNIVPDFVLAEIDQLFEISKKINYEPTYEEVILES